MILIVGLGNPGNKYEKTKHNVGFLILDKIVGEKNWNKSSSAKTLFFRKVIDDQETEYLKPQTFMNNSGFTVSYVQKKHNILSSDIIIIHDDLDLELGRIKISYDRGDGGHNGIKSIMESLGSQSFIRIRIGVSILDENKVLRKPNVLSIFSKKDLEMIEEEVATKVDSIIEIILKDGREVAMNKFNIN